MTELHTVEPAYVPSGKLGFLFDYLITMKCNFSCSYCTIGNGGHDNRVPHPSRETCATMLTQGFDYVSIINKYKQQRFKDCILNLLGGEVLYHPDIENIITDSSRIYEKYQSNFNLKRRCTTNASALPKKWKLMTEHIEEFTLSYHPESRDKFKEIFKNNAHYLNEIGKKFDTISLMYSKAPYWEDALEFLEYGKKHNFNIRPRKVDGDTYSPEQIKTLQGLGIEIQTVKGRSCCGGRSLCTNRDLKTKHTFVNRESEGFEGWHCSVPWFFLNANATTKEFNTNQDCRVRFDGTRGPLATIDTMDDYVKQTEERFSKPGIPTYKCVQKYCWCGTCAPKSKDLATLNNIMKIYTTKQATT